MSNEQRGPERWVVLMVASTLAALGLLLTPVALATYAARRTTHMSTGGFIVLLTMGSASLIASTWVFLRANALAARAAARASQPTWTDDGPALIAAAETEAELPIIVAERYPRITAVVHTLLLGSLAAVYPWNGDVPVPIAVATTAVAAIAVTVGCVRGWRMTLRIGADGILVRNYFRSYRIGFSQVRCFADGSANGDGENTNAWALRIMLHDGRVITARATMARRSSGESGTLAVVIAGARHFGIDAALTGKAVRRSRLRDRSKSRG